MSWLTKEHLMATRKLTRQQNLAQNVSPLSSAHYPSLAPGGPRPQVHDTISPKRVGIDFSSIVGGAFTGDRFSGDRFRGDRL